MYATGCCIILVFMLLYVAYFRVRQPFWTKQPVFHFYNFQYWFQNKGIINEKLPLPNSYTNFLNINTCLLTPEKHNDFVKLIQNNYLQNGENVYHPSNCNIIPYFPSSNSYISFYNYSKQTVGVITGRTMHLTIQGEIDMDIYYIDYLCVKKGFRGKNIAAQLIQTHEYNQRRLNPNIKVCVFKREDELTAIIPITTFYSKCFKISILESPNNYNYNHMLTGCSQNVKYFYDWIYAQKRKIYLLPSQHIFISLITSNNLYLEMYMHDGNIRAAYLFKKSCTSIEKGKEILTCICSVKEKECTKSEFIEGFIFATNKIVRTHEKKNVTQKEGNVYEYIAVEEIADNDIISKYLGTPLIVSPNAYFFYNFAHQPYAPKMVIIIS